METPQTAELPQFGRYEILEELGRGAMGVVYKAHDPLLDRLVAIKTIHLSLEGSEAAQYGARFQQEARAAGGLNHPNIVTVHDIGKSGEVAYLAMEFIEGVELRSLLRTPERVPMLKAVQIAAQIAEGLAYAHEHGVVHRDIKPPNIMVLPNGLVKITDFGIARMRTSVVQTQAGTMMGSPKYMSPEQVIGQRADHRSDIFALGIILYEMLAGSAPFTGESVTAIMYQIVNFAPPAPSAVQLDVPEMLDAIVAKMLVKKMDERYQSTAELARDLRACEHALAAAAPAPAPHAAAAAFSDGAGPAHVDMDARDAMLAQTVVNSRAGDAAAAIPAESPARGVARAFDSNEATMRIAALTTGPEVDPSAATVLGPAARGWSWRDGLALALSALAGLAVGALILLR